MKTFYTAEDIEQLAAQGGRELLVTEGSVVTDLARDTARRLGVALVRAGRGAPVDAAAAAQPLVPVQPVAAGAGVRSGTSPRRDVSKPRVFLDCADVRQVADAMRSGVIAGIATNSSKVAEMGKTVEIVYREIRSIFEGPIAVQAVGATAEELIRHAMQLSAMGPNTVVKIPTTAEGVRAIGPLVREGIQTNATLIFRPSQALAAALAGTPIISPFVGRADDIGLDGVENIAKIRKVYDQFGLDPLVIAASVRSAEQAIETIIAGADAVALRYEIFMEMMSHPMTDAGLAKFVEDVRRTQGSLADGQSVGSGGSGAVVDQLIDLVRKYEPGA